MQFEGSKDVRQSRSQPSLLSCQDPSGVVCFYVLQDAQSKVAQIFRCAIERKEQGIAGWRNNLRKLNKEVGR